MKNKISTVLLLLLLGGCTTFHSKQTESTSEGITKTTELTGSAWFSSAQHLSNIKVTQTSKGTQTFGSSEVDQQGATNVVAALEALLKLAQTLRPMP